MRLNLTRLASSHCPRPTSVAKHYLTSRASFNDTARYWAQAYAGAPTAAGGVGGATGLTPGGKKEKGDDAIALAGLDKSEVQKFENVSGRKKDPHIVVGADLHRLLGTETLRWDSTGCRL